MESGGGEAGGGAGGEGADIGSPRFYEDEMDEASRIWRRMRETSAGV